MLERKKEPEIKQGQNKLDEKAREKENEGSRVSESKRENESKTESETGEKRETETAGELNGRRNKKMFFF